MAIFDATDADKTYFGGLKFVVAVATDAGVGFGGHLRRVTLGRTGLISSKRLLRFL